MLGYILRRLLQVIPVFFGATLLIYFMVFALPGDPIIALFGDKTPNPAVVEQLRAQYHLDQPFIVQYFYYITGIFQGNLGSTFSGQSVNDVLARTLPVTARLAVMAIAIEFTLAIIIGTVSALRKGKLFDNTMLIIALIFVAYSTVLGWAYYGERNVERLIGVKGVMPYRLICSVVVFVGATVELSTVWTFSDVANGLMALPNLIGLLICSGLIARETKAYLAVDPTLQNEPAVSTLHGIDGLAGLPRRG